MHLGGPSSVVGRSERYSDGCDTDAELSAEIGDGEIRHPLPLDLPAPPIEPRLVVCMPSCPSHNDSPGTASDAAVRGPDYHARQGWFGRTNTAFRHRHRHLRGVYLIHDNDPTHTAAKTRDCLAGGSGWWRSRFTPVHTSWLDEAELLIGAFGYHYLKRGSWHSRAEFIDYVRQAWPEYNRLYAHPFEWTWSIRR